jgi:uncharacterized protein
MGLSLQEQLLKAGLVNKAKAQTVATEKRKHVEQKSRGHAAAPSTNDLAKAYAERAKAEKQEADRRAQEKQRVEAEKRERNERLKQFLNGKSLNQKDADVARNFEYGGKIRRIYVTAEQLKALNAGQLGVAQFKGSYLLLSRADALKVRELSPDHLALLVENLGPEGGSDYADDKFAVPDDLVW